MDAKQIQARAGQISKAASEGVPSASLIQLLDPLKQAPMSEEILRSSKIGVIVNRLRQNKDPAVGRLAAELIGKWKKDVGSTKAADGKHATARSSPAIKSSNGTASPAASPAPVKVKTKSTVAPEKRSADADGVKYELTGNKTRDSCLKLMYNGLAFMSEEAPEDVLEKSRAIEVAAFEKFQPETSEPYKTKMRSLFQNLKNKSNPQLRVRIMTGVITPSQFVVMSHQEMKSDERKAEDERIAKENMDKAMVAKEVKVYSTSLTCGRCKEKKIWVWKTSISYRASALHFYMAPVAAFDPNDLSQKARRDLLLLLEGIRGKKNLVLEKGLAGVVDLVVKYSTLQEYGVDQVFLLENANVDTSQRNVVFLVRGEKPRQVQAVAEQIKRVRQTSQIDHEFSIFWVPRRTLVSNQILEEDGVLGDVSISELPIYFIPLEKDLLSLQLEDSFGDLYLRKDPNAVFLTAKALMLLQQSHGLFPRIIGKGDNAKRLVDLLARMRHEASVESSASSISNSPTLSSKPSTTIEDVIILDRSIDPATPLLTQLTYEGLLDEVFTISNNHIEAPTSIRAGMGIPGMGGNAEAKGAGTKASDYSTLRRVLRLIVDDIDEHSPQDVAYAYSGYAPLSIRIVQSVLLKRYLATLTRASAGVVQQAKVAEEGVGASLGVKAGFKPFEDALRNVKGPSVEIEQGNEGKDGKSRERARAILKGSGTSAGKDKEKEKVTLVVFVGGVCYAEVAACRFVAGQLEKEGRARRIVVLTTSMISGDRMVGAAVQRQDSGNENTNGKP
ncbi:MAG: hypothetical protein Q9165_007762 [Trypethelium subeluteriae]